MIGEITDSSYEGTFNGIYFTDLVKTNAKADAGDSGGPVLTFNSNNECCLIGIIKAKLNSDNSMIYTKMSNIKTAFDLNARG